MKRLIETIWYVLTLRCEEADRVRAVGRREDLTRAERFGAWLHTAICRACWAARKQADRLDALMTMGRDAERAGLTQSESHALSPESEARIRDAIDDAAK